MPKPPVKTDEFQSLVEVIGHLRGPSGCPWDLEQTHSSLTQYAIEEAHELADAIDTKDTTSIVEELGDLLLQVVLHAEIGRQAGQFTLRDVIKGITEKMIHRHPHVFADTKVTGKEEVLENWSKIKQGEKSNQEGPFATLPKNLPALIRAQKIGAKTVRYKFDWENTDQVLAKVHEEMDELQEAIAEKSKDEQQNELGDVLFTLTQLARHLDFDSEQALRLTNRKFEHRFLKMQALVVKDQKVFSNLTTVELEAYWQKAKAYDEEL